MVNVAIIGCGLIGQKRARSLDGARLITCCDTIPEKSQALAAPYGALALTDWREAVRLPHVDAVLIATTHDWLAPIAAAAVALGKHVLVEKPGARRAAELDGVLEASRRTGAIVRTGFNHRYHPAFRRAREIFESGALGKLMFIRARYGHGGRLGYENEWRAQPEVSGGGEAIDQGLHLIDLARSFLGDFSVVKGHIGTFFWDMPVEDNAFFLLTNPLGQTASLHASWTEWKNMFSFEIYGRNGKLDIGGLGGSYGMERLTWHRMLPEMGPPESTVWEYPTGDESWGVEFHEFSEDIRLGRQPNPGIADAQAALRIVETVYREFGK